MQSKELIAFYKGTAGEFNKLGPSLGTLLIEAAAAMRNFVAENGLPSPIRYVPCQPCNCTGYVLNLHSKTRTQARTCISVCKSTASG